MLPLIVVSGILLIAALGAMLVIHFWILGRAASSQGEPGRMKREEIKELPSFDYKVEQAAEKMEEGAAGECAVCLEGFRDGESCRALPKCSHSFHAECIDSWLLKTGACPLCRTCCKITIAEV